MLKANISQHLLTYISLWIVGPVGVSIWLNGHIKTHKFSFALTLFLSIFKEMHHQVLNMRDVRL